MQTPYEPPVERGDDPLLPLPSGASAVNVLDSIRFVFEDDDWKTNVLLGMLFLFVIPVVGPIVFQGWLCEVHQRLARNHPRPMPKLDLSDFGHYLSRGVVPFLVTLVLSLPLGALVVLAYVGSVLGVVAGAAVLGEPAVAVLAVFAVAVAVGALSMVTGLVATVALTRAELTESFGDALSLRGLLGYLRVTWLQLLIKGITFSIVGMGLMLVGLALLCVGIYPVAVVLQIASVHLRWQHQRYPPSSTPSV